MDKFLEKHNLPKRHQEERESMNRLITAGEIEAAIRKLVHKSSVLESFTGEFYKSFKEELTPILLRLFQKNQKQKQKNQNRRREDSQTLYMKPASP